MWNDVIAVADAAAPRPRTALAVKPGARRPGFIGPRGPVGACERRGGVTGEVGELGLVRDLFARQIVDEAVAALDVLDKALLELPDAALLLSAGVVSTEPVEPPHDERPLAGAIEIRTAATPPGWPKGDLVDRKSTRL